MQLNNIHYCESNKGEWKDSWFGEEGYYFLESWSICEIDIGKINGRKLKRSGY